MQKRRVPKTETAYKGFIGKILDHIFTYYPDEEYFNQAKAGEPVYESIVDQVNAARDSALDMKKRFNAIDIDSNPEAAIDLKKELAQLQLESNQYRRVATAPDERPSFWRWLLAPGSINRRDQINSVELDKRRLRASTVRDDMNMIYMQAGVLSDLGKIDLNYQLKNYAAKTSLHDLKDEVEAYLDKMIGILNKTSQDLNQAGKSINTMKKTDSIKTNDREEKATVDAAIRYYKAMKETMQDVVTVKPSQKILGFGDKNPDGIDPDELSALMEGNSQAEQNFTLDDAMQLEPATYNQIADQMDKVAGIAERLEQQLPASNNSGVSESSVDASEQLDHEMDILNRMQESANDGAIDQVSADESADIVDEGQNITSDLPDLGQYVGMDYGTDFNKSVKLMKIDLKKKKAQLAAFASKLKKAAQKLKKKKVAAEVVKKKAKKAFDILNDNQ